MTGIEDNVDNIIYTTNYSTLTHVISKETIEIDYRCQFIRNGTESDYVFKDSAKKLKTFTFPKENNLVDIGDYAFYKCELLTEIDLSKCTKLRRIGKYSFSYCSKISSIILPSNNALEDIQESAFSSITTTFQIAIPNTTKTLGSNCFMGSYINAVTFQENAQIKTLPYGCFSYTLITSLKLPKSLTSFIASSVEFTTLSTIEVEYGNENYCVENNALLSIDRKTLIYYPRELKTCNIYSEVEIIGDSSFTASKLTEITFIDGITSIGAYSFSFAELKTVNIPSSVKTIKSNAFNECDEIETVNFAENSELETINDQAFRKCSSLKSISIPNTVTSIGTQCFIECSKLENVTLPSNIKNFGGGVFIGCPDTINIEFSENSTLIFDPDFYLIMNKEKTDLYQLLSNEFTYVEIPKTITTIKDSAFRYMTKLTTINFTCDNKLTKIENYAFDGCTNLNFINIPYTLETLSDYTFRDCYAITSLSFPSLTKIGIYCFSNCTSLQTIEIPKLTIIEKYSFISCFSLNSITLSDELISIQRNAFQNTTGLKNITFPSSLINISKYSFQDSGIEKINFKATPQITELSSYAFTYATSLTNINIPQTIQTIGTQCFSYTNLFTFTVPRETTSIGDSCFEGCTHLESFIIPEDCKLNQIGLFVFKGCSSLSLTLANNTHFVEENSALFDHDKRTLLIFPPASKTRFFAIPENVRTINAAAFYECKNLHTILIPEHGNLQQIGISAFQNCENLHIINIPSKITTFSENAFEGCSKLQCGLVVDVTGDALNDLINTAKFPAKALKQCNFKPTCNDNIYKFIPSTHFCIFLFKSYK